jgi:hypothetical protein
MTEAMNPEDKIFGIERLQAVCEDSCDLEPTKLLGRLFRETEVFSRGREQHDDMAAALFICGREGPAGCGDGQFQPSAAKARISLRLMSDLKVRTP